MTNSFVLICLLNKIIAECVGLKDLNKKPCESAYQAIPQGFGFGAGNRT